MVKKEKHYLGISTLLDLQFGAALRKDKLLADKLKKLIDKQIEIEVDEELWDYIVENYSKK